MSDDDTPGKPSSSRNPPSRKRNAAESPVNEQVPSAAHPAGKRWKGKGRANNEEEGQSPPMFSDPTKPTLDPIPEAAVEKLLSLKTKSRSHNRLDFFFDEIRDEIPAAIHSQYIKIAVRWFVKMSSVTTNAIKRDMLSQEFPKELLKRKPSCIKAFMCSSWYVVLLLI